MNRYSAAALAGTVGLILSGAGSVSAQDAPQARARLPISGSAAGPSKATFTGTFHAETFALTTETKWLSPTDPQVSGGTQPPPASLNFGPMKFVETVGGVPPPPRIWLVPVPSAARSFASSISSSNGLSGSPKKWTPSTIGVARCRFEVLSGSSRWVRAAIQVTRTFPAEGDNWSLALPAE